MTARRGLLFVIAAPSGTGKTTVCRAVVDRDPRIAFSVSHTTRARRAGERDGVDYHFVDAAEFERMVVAGEFLEHARYSGNLYGTSWAAIDEPLARGSDALLEIETEGARQVRERRGDARLIFLLPPSLPELEARLCGRGTDDAPEVARRLEIARREFAAAPLFEAFVVNERLEQAVGDVLELIGRFREGERGALPDRFRLSAARIRLDPALAAWLPVATVGGDG
jgi:guanylate kinase